MFIGKRTQGGAQGDGSSVSSVSEWLKAIVLFIMLYMVLAFGNFGTGFQYVGF